MKGERGRGFGAGLLHELVQTMAKLLFDYNRPPAPLTDEPQARPRADEAAAEDGEPAAPPARPTAAGRRREAPPPAGGARSTEAGEAPPPLDGEWVEAADGGRVPVWGPPTDAFVDDAPAAGAQPKSPGAAPAAASGVQPKAPGSAPAAGAGPRSKPPGPAPAPAAGSSRSLPPPIAPPPGLARPARLPDLPSPKPWEPDAPGTPDAGGDGPLPDWRRAMLEEAGLRPAGGDLGSMPGGGGARADGSVAGGTQYDGKSPHNWMIDGAYAGGYGRGSLRGPTDRTPLAEGERQLFAGPQGLPPFDDGPRRRWVPKRHPPEQREALMAWVHQLYDAPTQHLLERISDEPLFAYGSRQWRQAPDARANNQAIAEAVYLRLSRLMGAIYGFEPAVLAYTPQMPAAYFEWYDWERNQLFVLEQVLGGTYADLMEALSHGQAHSLQRQLIIASGAGKLEGELAGFGDLMVREYRAQPGPGCIGWVKGYHAFQISYAVGYRARSLA